MNIAEMREQLASLVERSETLHAEFDELTELEDRSDEQDARIAELEGELDDTLGEAESLRADIDKAEEREAKRAELRDYAAKHPDNVRMTDAPNVIVQRDDPFDLSSVRRWNDSPEAGERDLIERARRVIGESDGFRAVGPDAQEAAERTVRTVLPEHGYSAARHVLNTSSPTYIRAYAKTLSERGLNSMTAEEREALNRADREYAVTESRAASVGTATAGGNLIPTILDPSVIASNDGHVNPFRAISNIKTVLNDNGWTGITSTGVTGSWDTEGSEVSDDAPVFAQPNVPVYKAAIFIPGSIEVFDDVPTLVAELGTMIAYEKDRLEEAAFATGSGSNQPTGIVTALDANTASEVAMATNSTFAVGDLFTAAEALGARYRPRASWVMNLVHINDIREFGGTSYYTRTITLDSPQLGEVLGRPVYESTTMTSTLDANTNNSLVYGDFSGFVIADRIGLRTEFIPHLFATGNNRPSGQRGIYAHWRVGSDAVNDTGFVLLQNPSTL